MNILIPMAGAGKRFKDQGIDMPKPLILIDDKPIIQHVLESIKIEGNFIFAVQREHYEQFNLELFLKSIKPDCKIIIIESLTEGAASTCLLAKDLINNDDKLLICDSDSIVKFQPVLLGNYLMDGAILTFNDDKPCWSFVESNGNLQKITKVEEKNPISNYASCGRYYWKHGKDFVYYAEKMISDDNKTNGEYYVSSVYSYAINDGKNIINVLVDEFDCLGTPEYMNEYIAKLSHNNL
jgi:dTDP-glucose pyrophosphorylase